MFCSDGLDPIDITKFGHIDHCIREAVKLALNLTDAISMASKIVLIITTWEWTRAVLLLENSRTF